MPYIGNQHNVGDHVNNFKVLDDISSYTATFDGSATSVVSTTSETIRIPKHRFIQGQRVTYNNGGGSNIGGLTSGTAYYVSFDSANTIKLATSLANANSNTVINLSTVGGGTSHTLNAAFDGINTKFKLTFGSGNSARLNNATQINVAINNVIQRPNLDANNFSDGFALADNHKIVFKTAPTSQDIFWGSIIANTIENFDLRDNEVDNFTGNGSTTEFNLSTIPANNESIIVTIDGVLQHPSDKDTVRAYTLIDSILQFTAAPALNAEIQARHIGFAGASTADVSGFYGRTGNVVLGSTDHITTGDITSRNINASGIITAASANFGGNVSIGGTLTYEDVANIDSVGIITARDGIFIPDNKKLSIGNAAGNTGDLQLFHTTNHSIIRDYGTGSLLIQGSGVFIQNSNGGTNVASFLENTGVSIPLDLDVDGHTNLDNVSIAGISTFSDDIIANGQVAIGTDIVPSYGNLFVGVQTSSINYVSQPTARFAIEGASSPHGDASAVHIGQRAGGSSDPAITFHRRSGDVAWKSWGARIHQGGLDSFRFSFAPAALPGSHTFTDEMIIKRAVGVGIGTDDPQEKLHIHEGHIVVGQDSGSNTNIRNYIKFGRVGAPKAAIGFINTTGNSRGDILFMNSDVSNTSAFSDSDEIVRFTREGKIGIGTDSPDSDAYIHIVGPDNGKIILEDNDNNGANLRKNYIGIQGSDNLILAADEADLGTSSSIRFRIDNTEKACIDNSGRIGIGTNNPVRPLHILAADCRIRLEDAGVATDVELQNVSGDAVLTTNGASNLRLQTNNTERFRITAGGQVRIGNTTETVSSGADDLVVGTTSGERGITILSGTNSNGNIYFGDTDTTGVQNRMGSIRYVHDGNYMRFSTNGNQERLRITSDGKVGIGTNNPQSALDLANDSGTNPLLHLRHSNADVEGEVIRIARTDNPLIRYHSIRAKHGGAVANNYITFNLHDGTSGGGYTAQKEVVRITGDGKVGIGTDNPQQALHILRGEDNHLLYLQGGDTICDIVQSDNGGSTRLRSSNGYFYIWTGGDGNSSTGANGSPALRLASNLEAKFYNTIIVPDRIQQDGYTHTAIRFPAAHTITFETDQNERLRITPTGNVGINSTSPAATLDIHDVGSTGPCLLLRGGSSTEGDIVVPDGEALAFGHWNYSSSTFTERLRIDSSGDVFPGADNGQDLGTSSKRWANVYSADLQLSNKGKTNDVDGTWGDYTIQEGESDLFLINNRNGKKYKFNLTEVS